jgi:hypothetical protein
MIFVKYGTYDMIQGGLCGDILDRGTKITNLL